MATKALDLFQAFKDGKLPKDEGYIVSSFFSERSKYSIYEIVAYSGVKSIYATAEGITFQTDCTQIAITNYLIWNVSKWNNVKWK